MDEIEKFASMRPTDVAFDASERAALHRLVFEDSQQESDDVVDAVYGAGQAGEFPELGTSGRSLALAAVLVVGAALSVIGAWSIMDRADVPTEATDETPSDVSTTTATSTAPSTSSTVEVVETVTSRLSLNAIEPPRVLVDLPGWEIRSVSNWTQQPDMVLVTEEQGLEGPVAIAGLVEGRRQLNLEAPTVMVGDSVAIVRRGAGGILLLLWTDPAGNDLMLEGWQIDQQTAAGIASSLSMSIDGVIEAPDTVAGLVQVDDESKAALARGVNYEFQGPSDTGVELSLKPGGRLWEARQADPELDEPLTLGDESGTIWDFGTGRYQVRVVREFWYWEIDGSSFESRESFLEFVSSLQIVDIATWNQAVPEDVRRTDNQQSEDS